MALGRKIGLLFVAALCSLSVMAAQTVTLENGSNLELKGIGVATEFRTETYIGALYAPVGFESIELFKDYTTPKRMVVRYIPETYSYRKVSRHFKERIAMNNDREIWQPLTREIITFSRIFNDNFVRGDEIRLDFIPGKGTQVYLNDVLFETIENPEFFNLMLDAWTGTVPPSKAFKQGIMGELSDADVTDLKNRFTSLEPITGRFTKPDNQVAAATRTQAKQPEVKQTPKPKPEPKKEVAESKPKPEPKKEVAESKPNPEPKKEVAESKPKPKPEPKKEVAVAKPEPEPEEDFIDEDLIRGSYVRDLIAEVRENQEYPRRALLNGDKGDGMAKITIDRAGDLVEVELTERTGSRILDKAIVKMVRRSAPFQGIPPELSEEEFTFEVPFTFTF